MKKLFAIIFALLIVTTIAVPASAVTPTIKVPSINIPDFEVHVEIPQSFWDKWFADHPITIPKSTESTEPVETEPESTELEAPVIIKSQFYHGRYQKLWIEWGAVEGAESYEVLITKADGETNEYTTESTIVYDSGAQCPRVYIDKTSTWASATVKARAVCGDAVSEWSEEKKIGCDMLHFM